MPRLWLALSALNDIDLLSPLGFGVIFSVFIITAERNNKVDKIFCVFAFQNCFFGMPREDFF